MSERVLRLLDEIWSAQKGQLDEAGNQMIRMAPLIAEIRAIHETGASPGDEITDLNFDNISPQEAFKLFRSVPWGILPRLRGNPHSSLIGLLSHWWLNRAADSWVLDGPPQITGTVNGEPNVKRAADLILGSGSLPSVVVEVEGTNHLKKLDTLGMYLRSTESDFSPIDFGVLVSYAYPPERPVVPIEDIAPALSDLTSTLNGKWVFVLELSKEPVTVKAPLMQRNEYYQYQFKDVRMTASVNGSVTATDDYIVPFPVSSAPNI